nr:hypothetical protein [uncultured Desulfobacter sp.]
MKQYLKFYSRSVLNFYSLLTFFVFSILLNSQASAFIMSEYFPLKSGNILIFDLNVFTVGPDTHDFGSYSGQAYIDSREYYDSVLYIYSGPDGILVVGSYDPKSQQYNNFPSVPFKLASGEMNIGDSVTSTTPAGPNGEPEITITSTLQSVENVTTSAGIFNNTLKLKIEIDDETGQYVETIWLAKAIGIVKTYRLTETPINHDGCLFSCGTLDYWDDSVQKRDMNLLNYVIQNNFQGDFDNDGDVDGEDLSVFSTNFGR